MQLWAVYVFGRNCPHGSLVQSDAALQTPESHQESQRQREGRRENPSFLPQPQLARNLYGIAGRMLCPPGTTCLLALAGEPGGLVLVLHGFLLSGGGRGLCLKGTIPDRASEAT